MHLGALGAFFGNVIDKCALAVTTNAFDAVAGEKCQRRIVIGNGQNKNTLDTKGDAILAQPFVGSWNADDIIFQTTMTTQSCG